MDINFTLSLHTEGKVLRGMSAPKKEELTG
jgi:hypothetical protein